MPNVLDLIRARHSERSRFDPSRPVPPEALQTLLEAARWAPTAHNMQNFQVVAVDDPGILRSLAELKRAVSPVFIRENYAQLSFSKDELGRRRTGLLATRFPPAWRHPELRKGEPGDEEAVSLGPLLAESPLLLVFLYDPAARAPASEGDFLGILSLGCVLQNLWLAAQELGLGVHVLSSLGSPDLEPEVKRLLVIPATLRIAFSVRLGFPLEPDEYLRVRREVKDFTHRNRYRTKG
jgi:nitroreductase